MAFHGHDSYLTYGKETTFGQLPDNVNKWMGIVQSFSPEETNNLQVQYGLGSRNFQQARVNTKGYTSSSEFLVQNLDMFEFALGSVSSDSTADANGFYTHTFSEAKDLPSISLEAGVLGTNNFVRQYVGSKVDTLTISAEKEDALTAEVEFISKDMKETETANQPVADTSSYFLFSEGIITINGQKQALVESFELEISNALEALYAINGENVAARIQEGNREYTLSLTFTFEDTAQWELWKNGSEFEATLTFTAPDGRELQINCTGAKYDTNTIELAQDSYLTQELEARVKSVNATYKSKEQAL